MSATNDRSASVGRSDVVYAGSSSSFLGIRLSFTQGFLAGQLSVVIIALLAIRFIIFEDSRAPKARPRRPSALPIRTSRSRKSGLAGLGASKDAALAGSGGGAGDAATAMSDRQEDVARVMSDILSKVDYEMDSHAGESIDWVNVIFAQALAGYRQDIAAGGWSFDGRHSAANDPLQTNGTEQSRLQRTAQDWMEEILNANTVGRGMSFLDPIQVTHVEFGDSYPILSNAKVRPADDMGRMRIELDVDYADCISLAIETKLLINFPRPRFAVLPISLGLTIERFSGTLAIELLSNSDSTSAVLPKSVPSEVPRSRHELHFSLHPDFTLDASASSLVGSRAKLQDLPKIEQLLVGRVRSYIHDRFVWPKYWTLTLPNLAPRHMKQAAKDTGEAGMSSTTNPANAGHNVRGVDVRGNLMHVHGPGDVLAEEEGGQHDARQEMQSGVFFEQAPPLFPGMLNHHVDQSLPGTLPSVEAWRSHAAKQSLAVPGSAALGRTTDISTQDRVGHNPPARSMAESRHLPPSKAMSSASAANLVRHSDVRQRQPVSVAEYADYSSAR